MNYECISPTLIPARWRIRTSSSGVRKLDHWCVPLGSCGVQYMIRYIISDWNRNSKGCRMKKISVVWIPSGECILQQQWQLRRLSWIDWSWISQWLLLGLLVQTEICRTLQDLLRAQSPARQQDVSFNSIGHCTTIKYFTSYLFSVSTPIYALQSASTQSERGKGARKRKYLQGHNCIECSSFFN